MSFLSGLEEEEREERGGDRGRRMCLPLSSWKQGWGDGGSREGCRT